MNSNPPDSEPQQTNCQQQDVRLSFSRYVLFFLPMILGATADLVSKAWVFKNYFDPERVHQDVHWWIEDHFGIQTSTNPGALFGIGQGYSLLFASLSVVALLAVMIWLFKFKAAQDCWLTFTLGIISGGIIGNFYDRVGLGYVATYPIEIKNNVRDWIYFQWEGIWFLNPWPNFNFADSLLVCGAIMLMIHALFFATVDQQEPSS